MARKASTEKPERKPERKQRASRTRAGTGLELSGTPRVNLLPPSERERRAATTLVRRWIGVLVATVAVVSALVAGAHGARGLAAAGLAAEQDDTLTLNAELAGLAHVSQTFDRRDTLTTMRAEAMGNDTEWRDLFASVTRTIPGDVELTGIEITAGANPIADQAAEAGLGPILLLTLESKDLSDQSRTISRLRDLDDVLVAEAGAASAVEGGFSFIVGVLVDQSHYSNDFDTEAGVK